MPKRSCKIDDGGANPWARPTKFHCLPTLPIYLMDACIHAMLIWEIASRLLRRVTSLEISRADEQVARCLLRLDQV